MYKVLIELRIGRDPVGPVRITEEYSSWIAADTAYVHWQKLAGIQRSVVSHVELVEERQRRVHKAHTKGTPVTIEGKPENNVTELLGVSDGNCARI